MQTLLKCHIIQNFIWVFTVCQSIDLEVSSIQCVKKEVSYMYSNPVEIAIQWRSFFENFGLSLHLLSKLMFAYIKDSGKTR